MRLISQLFQIALIVLLWASQTARAADPVRISSLPPESRLAIVGDSITESKRYSRVIEVYLVACLGRKDISVCNYGWGGDIASNCAMRLKNDLTFFRPTAVTLCYGMNDAAYHSYSEANGRGFERGMRAVLEQLPGEGVSLIVLGSPGAVDTRYFRQLSDPQKSASPAEIYNATLGHLRDIDRQLAGEYKIAFADIHTPLMDSMQKAKAALGQDYPVCGSTIDGAGFHPGPNGSLVMAGEFLKSLGCDGALAEINVDMQAGATTSAGHSVLSAAGGKIQLESARYPFCFESDPKAIASARSMLPFYSFNRDLNRFMLKVAHLKSAKARVTWGGKSKEFPRQQLESGINLAAEFDSTPFDAAFLKFMDAVVVKQNQESQTIKGLFSSFRALAVESHDDKELLAAMQQFASRLSARRDRVERELYASLPVVRHSIEIVEVQ